MLTGPTELFSCADNFRLTLALSVRVHVPVADWPLPDLDGAEFLDAASAAGSHVRVGHVEALALVAAGAAGQAMRRGREG